MTFGASNETLYQASRLTSISTFPASSQLETDEQRRRFELLRLAFFVLKLRKLEQEVQGAEEAHKKSLNRDYQFRCSLLRHTIFQQVVTLTRLDAREQALQLINTCRR
ncbi:MAG TPA: hypothetical protein DHW02_16430 [Ktedonobacter sp.]|nr:hypothetical protein [Ktedonobacter sp.]